MNCLASYMSLSASVEKMKTFKICKFSHSATTVLWKQWWILLNRKGIKWGLKYYKGNLNS